jgi:hypothetical protein
MKASVRGWPENFSDLPVQNRRTVCRRSVIDEAPDGSEKCQDRGERFNIIARFSHSPAADAKLMNWSTSSLPNAISEDLTVGPRSEPFLFATDYPRDGPGGRMTLKDVALRAAHPTISDGDKEKMRTRSFRQV